MEQILSNYSASISELKQNPTALLKKAGGDPIAILNHNRPTAYLVPVEVYEALLDLLEDYELGQLVQDRQAEKDAAIEVDVNEL